MRTVAFVPIKLNNERFPGKNIKKFSDGTPLIQVVLKKLVQLKNEKLIDEIYVYCSDAAIKNFLPLEVSFLERPSYLDDKFTKGKQIYEEFVKTIEADVYLLEHVTTPLVEINHIRECIEMVQSGKYDSAFCAKKMQTFFWKSGKPFNFDLYDPPRTQDMEPLYIETTSTYVFTKNVFAKYRSRTSPNPYICECSEIEAVDIDYPEDFEIADAIYTKQLR